MIELSITLNGVRRSISCVPGETLRSVLRREGCFSVRYRLGKR